jgi:hypothetical protein
MRSPFSFDRCGATGSALRPDVRICHTLVHHAVLRPEQTKIESGAWNAQASRNRDVRNGAGRTPGHRPGTTFDLAVQVRSAQTDIDVADIDSVQMPVKAGRLHSRILALRGDRDLSPMSRDFTQQRLARPAGLEPGTLRLTAGTRSVSRPLRHWAGRCRIPLYHGLGSDDFCPSLCAGACRRLPIFGAPKGARKGPAPAVNGKCAARSDRGYWPRSWACGLRGRRSRCAARRAP